MGVFFNAALLFACAAPGEGRSGARIADVSAAAVPRTPTAERAPQPQSESPPPAAPRETQPPAAFAGLERVSVRALLDELGRAVPVLAASPAVQQDYRAFLTEHGLEPSAALELDYVRVRLVFEATRDGGLWQLSWAITDQEPSSKRTWQTWAKQGRPGPGEPTAIAECDELSALFAFLVRGLGVAQVGLFWPTANHTVAVWTIPRDAKRRPERIVVPTSQIFLDEAQSLGTRAFDPWRQKTIFDYRPRDVDDAFTLPADLARFFVEQVYEHGGKSQSALQAERNRRSAALAQQADE